MATIRTSGLPSDFRVKPHVQAFADAAETASGVNSFGTYGGRQPSADLAVDCFVSPSNRAPGDKLCEWAMANYKRLAVDYLIFQRRIWNPEISTSWRPYSGPSPHTDHVHVSFNPTAPAQPNPQPTQPNPEDEEMALPVMINGDKDSGTVFITWDGTKKFHLAQAADIDLLGGLKSIITIEQKDLDAIPRAGS